MKETESDKLDDSTLVIAILASCIELGIEHQLSLYLYPFVKAKKLD